MRVIAIVPAWQARARLPEVIAALAGQVARIIVVDNGSTDGTADWLSDAQGAGDLAIDVTVIRSPTNRGYAAAVNQGLTRALADGAEAVLLVNDDAVFAPGAVSALAAALTTGHGIGAASAKMVYRDRPDILNGTGGYCDLAHARAALRGAGEPDRGQYDRLPDVDYPSGAASLLARAALEVAGPLDEAWYLYYEDVDWGLRARSAGWRSVFVPAARVIHVGSASTAADPARRRYYNVRNRLRFAERWCPARGRVWAWSATLVLLAKQPIRWCWPSRRSDAEAVMWAVADHLRGQYGRSARFG